MIAFTNPRKKVFFLLAEHGHSPLRTTLAVRGTDLPIRLREVRVSHSFSFDYYHTTKITEGLSVRGTQILKALP